MTTISFNPQQTTSPANSFLLQTEGWVQGSYFDDPSSKNWLAAGLIASSVTQAVWGGMAITENIPNINTNQAGNNLVLAATNVGITGFTVFNQANNMIITPGNTVQQAGSGMSVSYFRFNSNARIAVQCSASLASSLQGDPTNTQVSWDLVNQVLVPYSAGYASNAVTNAVWASTAGGQTTFTVTTNPTGVLSAGDTVTTSGIVNTGGSSTAAFNGVFTVVSVTSTTVVVSQPAAGSVGTYASGGLIAGNQGGALACKVLGFNNNSKIVQYNSTTGILNWGVGPAAIIQI